MWFSEYQIGTIMIELKAKQQDNCNSSLGKEKIIGINEQNNCNDCAEKRDGDK